MTYTIDFSAVEEKQLADIARKEGLEPAAYIKKIVSEHLPPVDPAAHVRALLTKWQGEDHTPALPPVPTRPGETPTEALFRTWEEEDAKLSPEEREQQEQLWEDFQQGINETRRSMAMRTLF